MSNDKVRWPVSPAVSRDPALTVPCPQCEVPAGMGCLGKRGNLVHASRRAVAYRRDYPTPTQTTGPD